MKMLWKEASTPYVLHESITMTEFVMILNSEHAFLIENYYTDIVKCIHTADLILPKCIPSVQKTYWDEQLSILKKRFYYCS